MSFKPIKIWEEINKLAERNEDLRDELEIMDLKIQHICSDTGQKWWVHIKKDLEFGSGEMEYDVKLTATEYWWDEMLARKIKGGRAYLEGNLIIDGKFSDAIEYGGFLGVLAGIQEEDKEENANQIN